MNKIQDAKLLKVVLEYAQIIIGVLFASIGLKAFLLPNGFLDGGITGVALLVNNLSGVNISVLLVLFSLPFLILAYYTISPYMVFKSSLSIVALALVIEFENFEMITEDELLISIFGGLFLGLGIGVSIRNGAVLDGSEVLGIYLNRHLGVSIGTVILTFNILLFIITAILVSLETAMYSTLAFLVTTRVIDLTIEGFENYIGLIIISDLSDEIQHKIHKELGVGITVLESSFGFGKGGVRTNQKIIKIIINRIEIIKINKIINNIDPAAFVVEFDVNSVKGGVLRKIV